MSRQGCECNSQRKKRRTAKRGIEKKEKGATRRLALCGNKNGRMVNEPTSQQKNTQCAAWHLICGWLSPGIIG